MRQKAFLIIVLIVALSLSLVLPSMVYAQSPAKVVPTSRDITISPFLQTVTIAGSEATKTFPVELTNGTKTDKIFNLSVLDFGTLGETGGLVFAGANASSLVKKYGLASWLQLDMNTLTIAAGQKAKVTATITNANDLSPGGHYAAIVATVDASEASGSNTVNLKQKISSLVFATKTGGETHDLHLASMTSNASWHSLPTEVVLRFQNKGNVHVVPRGLVELKNPVGQVISKGVINEASSYVLPESTRALTVNLTAIKKSLSRPGAYHLVVNYRYDGYENYATRTATVKYVPLVLVLLTIVILTGLIIIVRKQLIHKPSEAKKLNKN